MFARGVNAILPPHRSFLCSYIQWWSHQKQTLFMHRPLFPACHCPRGRHIFKSSCLLSLNLSFEAGCRGLSSLKKKKKNKISGCGSALLEPAESDSWYQELLAAFRSSLQKKQFWFADLITYCLSLGCTFISSLILVGFFCLLVFLVLFVHFCCYCFVSFFPCISHLLPNCDCLKVSFLGGFFAFPQDQCFVVPGICSSACCRPSWLPSVPEE